RHAVRFQEGPGRGDVDAQHAHSARHAVHHPRREGGEYRAARGAVLGSDHPIRRAGARGVGVKRRDGGETRAQAGRPRHSLAVPYSAPPDVGRCWRARRRPGAFLRPPRGRAGRRISRQWRFLTMRFSTWLTPKKRLLLKPSRPRLAIFLNLPRPRVTIAPK